MANQVSLARFNELRFPNDPQPMTTLRDLARSGKLPGAFQLGGLGGKWMMDLDVYDAEVRRQLGAKVVLSDATDIELDQQADEIFQRLENGFRKAS